MFAGVNLMPHFFSKTLKVQDGKSFVVFRGNAKDMYNFLGNGTMLLSCSRPQLSVQAIRDFLNIQCSHLFLQDVAIMAEQNLRVKHTTEQPEKCEFASNLKAAKQIGLTIPPNVLVRADKVIR